MNDTSIKSELARIDERTRLMEASLAEIHQWMVGNGGDGVLRKIKANKVQLTIQWGLFLVLFGLVAWVLKS